MMRSTLFVLMFLLFPVSASAQPFVLTCLLSSTSGTVQPEPPGANCSAGGQRVDVPACTIPSQSAQTYYICNGVTGSTGSQGPQGDPGESVVGASESPGLNCTHGGTALILSGGTSYACNGAPGATGSIGATGATGATGSDAPKIVYVDQDDIDIPNLVLGQDVLRYDIEAMYWDEADHAFWPVNTVTGTVDYTENSTIYYEASDCTGQALIALNSLQQVMYGLDGAGVAQYWLPGSAYTPSICYAWNNPCSEVSCPQYSQLAEDTASLPSFSAFAPPFHLKYIQ